MKKLILSSLIVTMLFFGGTANAGLAGVAAGVAGVVVGGVALGGEAVFASFTLGTFGGSVLGIGMADLSAELTGYGPMIILIGVGLITLDENRQVVEFKSIDPSNASEQGLTEDEATVYNEDLAIINLAYDEFSKRYDDEMIQEEATTAYNEVATDVGLSSGARSVLSKVFVHALEK